VSSDLGETPLANETTGAYVPPTPVMFELIIARAVRAAVRALPDVSDLSAGLFAEVATYGLGERVDGVAVSHTTGALAVEVHVVATYSDALVLPELADRVRDAVREAVASLAAGPMQRIDVAIDDLRTGGERGR